MATLSDHNQTRPLSSLPVILGHLNHSSFSVQITAPTRNVFEDLRLHPDYPGVIILNGRNCLGVISRQRCFEQLGQPYGIEIFLRRPLQVLFEKVFYPVQPLPSSTSIEAAVQVVLRRPLDQVYEPVLMIDSSQQLHLIDLHELLLAHSQLLVNANRMVKNQLQIEQSLFTALQWEQALQQIVLQLSQIIPYDRVIIFIESAGKLQPIASVGFDTNDMPASIEDDSLEVIVFHEIQQTHNPLLNIGQGPVRDLSYSMNLPSPKAWLGLPLLINGQAAGMIALSRITETRISQDEITMAMNFTIQAGIALQNAWRYEQAGLSMGCQARVAIGLDPQLIPDLRVNLHLHPISNNSLSG